MKKLLLMLVFLFLFKPSVYAENEMVFSGLPKVKISEGGLERTPEVIERKDAVNLSCLISKIDGKYYWSTRKNTELIPIDNNIFITFVALNGSGYIRVIKHEYKEAASLMSSTEEQYDYVEHLLIGLRSVTYYGNFEPL